MGPAIFMQAVGNAFLKGGGAGWRMVCFHCKAFQLVNELGKNRACGIMYVICILKFSLQIF